MRHHCGMQLRAYAKINWDLHVLGKRADGFHALDTVMVNVELHDRLEMNPAEELIFTCDDPGLPSGDDNLVVKAARTLASASGYTGGARIHLTKNIPAGGGMGGGSSDAACTLTGLNRLWNLNWTIERLQPLAAALGSDVAFFLYGGWRRCLGRGEIVEALGGSEQWPAIQLLLIIPPWGVATPSVYKHLQAHPYNEKHAGRCLTDVNRQLDFFLKNVQQGKVGLTLVNALTEAACQVEPRLVTLQGILQDLCPGRWLMSGSGAVHYVVTTRGDDDGAGIRDALFRKAGPGIRVLTTTTFTP